MERPKKYRTIVVDDVEYYWYIGHRNLNIRCSKDKGSITVPIRDLIECSYKDGSLLDNRCNLDAIITPVYIANIIKNNKQQ